MLNHPDRTLRAGRVSIRALRAMGTPCLPDCLVADH